MNRIIASTYKFRIRNSIEVAANRLQTERYINQDRIFQVLMDMEDLDNSSLGNLLDELVELELVTLPDLDLLLTGIFQELDNPDTSLDRLKILSRDLAA